MYDMPDYVADVLDDRDTSWCPADDVSDVLGVCFAWNILGDYKWIIGSISKQYVLYVLYVGTSICCLLFTEKYYN
jgi:hypothetical protein